MFYNDIFGVLNKYKVKYVVVGGTAVNLHGVPRFTADLDLIIDLERKNVLKFVKALKEVKFKPKVPVQPEDFAVEENRRKWIEEKKAVVFSFHNIPHFDRTVDVFINNPIQFSELEKRKIVLNVSGVKISLVSLSDLICLKKQANRRQDLSDIESLEKVRRIYEEDRQKRV